MNNKTGTFTENSNTISDVKLQDMLEISNELQRGFVAQFNGIEVRVDPGLEGNRFYMAVSQKLLTQIEKCHG